MSLLEHRRIIFFPALGRREEIDQFDECVMKHECVSACENYYFYGKKYYEDKNNNYYEYVPVYGYWDINDVLVDFAGVFDTDITFWGRVEDEYEDHISWYNVVFNKKYCSVIGSIVSIGKGEHIKGYSLVEDKNLVIHGLRKARNVDINPTMLILKECAYCPNSVAQEEYEHDKYLYIKENDKSKSSDDEDQIPF